MMTITYFEINRPHVLSMLELARVGKNDLFLDLGCGRGLAVRMAVTEFGAKAIGVEKNSFYYEAARKLAIKSLTKSQLKKVDFWYGDVNNADISPDDNNEYVFNYKRATVVYDSFNQTKDDVWFYKKRLRKSVRLVRKDLPLYPYKPVAVSRKSNGCWFFLHKFPLKSVKSEREWCYHVLAEKDKQMRDVYAYYRHQLAKHFKNDHNKKYLVESTVKDLKKLVAKRPFPKK